LGGSRACTEFVITKYRGPNCNLRTQFQRILAKAGLKPWPKLFQNLRATRETELAEEHPIHVVCAWMGNSKAVAIEHYLQVTDAHFEKAARNPAQQAAVPSAIESHGATQKREKRRESAVSSDFGTKTNGRHRTRTCDFHRVRMAL
jgi:hypothetical protein